MPTKIVDRGEMTFTTTQIALIALEMGRLCQHQRIELQTQDRMVLDLQAQVADLRQQLQREQQEKERAQADHMMLLRSRKKK